MVVPYGTFMPQSGRALLEKLQEAGVTVLYLPKDLQSCPLAEKLHSYRAVIRNLRRANMKKMAGNT